MVIPLAQFGCPKTMQRKLSPFPCRDPAFCQQQVLRSKDLKVNHACKRFAAKEALFKALRISSEGVRLNEIETLNDGTGAPVLRLYGALEKCCKDLGITTIHVSLTNDSPYSMAFVVCEKE